MKHTHICTDLKPFCQNKGAGWYTACTQCRSETGMVCSATIADTRSNEHLSTHSKVSHYTAHIFKIGAEIWKFFPTCTWGAALPQTGDFFWKPEGFLQESEFSSKEEEGFFWKSTSWLSTYLGFQKNSTTSLTVSSGAEFRFSKLRLDILEMGL